MLTLLHRQHLALDSVLPECIGYTSTDSVYIAETCIEQGDCTGPISAGRVLQDPSVAVTVLECARGGMLRSGLPETVKPDGYAILNADDDPTYQMREQLRCQLALFSTQATNLRIREHCRTGGIAAIVDDGFVTIRRGNILTQAMEVRQIPLAFGGKALFMVENILAATLAGYYQSLTVEQITEYRQTEATHKVGILTGVGDRRDGDIVELGQIAGELFDEIIIRLDEDRRGRPAEDIVTLISEGIRATDAAKMITCIPDELEALRHAIWRARPGTLIVHLTEKIKQAIEVVEKASDVVFRIYWLHPTNGDTFSFGGWHIANESLGTCVIRQARSTSPEAII